MVLISHGVMRARPIRFWLVVVLLTVAATGVPSLTPIMLVAVLVGVMAGMVGAPSGDVHLSFNVSF